MITQRTLNRKVEDREAKAVRFGLYYGVNSKAAQNLLEVKRIFTEHYREPVSYSVLVSILLDFFLKHHATLYKKENPEL